MPVFCSAAATANGHRATNIFLPRWAAIFARSSSQCSPGPTGTSLLRARAYCLSTKRLRRRQIPSWSTGGAEDRSTSATSCLPPALLPANTHAAATRSSMRSKQRRTNMRAMRAEKFRGYEGLKLVDLPKPAVTDGKVLVRMTAAGVTPLDHTILSGQFPLAKAPLVLGNEGAGGVEEGGGTDFPAGSRGMFTGSYGVFEDGAYSEWLAVRKESLCLVPQGVDDVSAAGIPVAYLTAQMALNLAGFQAGKTVLAPAIGGSVGNAVTQLARALGANHAFSARTNHRRASRPKSFGFMEALVTSSEKLGDGVRRITSGYGADIVIDGIGGEVLSEALGALALDGSLTTLGYSAGRKATIDVTNLIWQRASIKSLNMFAQPPAAISGAWNVIVSLLKSGAIKPIVAKTFPLAEAAAALRYLVKQSRAEGHAPARA